jgi:oligosaccharide reducing-end xylanase
LAILSGSTFRPGISVAQRLLSLGCLCLGLAACSGTEDALGEEGVTHPALRPLQGPDTYPNPFRDVLGKSEAEIAAKLDNAWDTVFYGDPATYAIYFKVGEDQAYIQDILHGDVRSEGMGLGMLIAVQLDKHFEFDRLWRYAKATLEYSSGPKRGYFRSSCASGASGDDSVPCEDPYGHQSLLMALLFAHGRWGSSGDIDYEAEVWRVLDVMRGKEAENGGVVDDITNLFDGATSLVVDVPQGEGATRTRPSNVMPAYYELWAQATGDSHWNAAAEAARTYLASAAHADTGLYPARTTFAGAPLEGSSNFGPESYRTQLSVTLDKVWFDEAWAVTESDKLLDFFSSQGIDSYGKSYTLAGEVVESTRESALVSMNGVSGASATVASRADFIEAVWNQQPPSGVPRYYQGILHMMALLTLSGQMRVY